MQSKSTWTRSHRMLLGPLRSQGKIPNETYHARKIHQNKLAFSTFIYLSRFLRHSQSYCLSYTTTEGSIEMAFVTDINKAVNVA